MNQPPGCSHGSVRFAQLDHYFAPINGTAAILPGQNLSQRERSVGRHGIDSRMGQNSVPNPIHRQTA